MNLARLSGLTASTAGRLEAFTSQCFEKSLSKEYAWIHIGILIMVWGIILNEGFLEVLTTCTCTCRPVPGYAWLLPDEP